VSRVASFGGGPGGGGCLVLAAGSSTIDFTLFAVGADRVPVRTVEGRLDQLDADARFHAKDATGRAVADLDCADDRPPGHRIAVEFLLNWLEQHAGAVSVRAVGHHVAHGGARFSGPARIDAPTLQYLQALVPLAPARQPQCLLPIQAIAERWPELPQVACFETAFHRDVPAVEQTLPLPRSISGRDIRRYGYDGLAFECIVDALPAVDMRASDGKTIIVHVADGASLCALDGGRSIAMTTGFSDLDGLPAGTRCGRLDPGVVLHLMTELRMDSAQVGALLRQRSGLLGLSGLAGDLDRLLRSDAPRARFAVELFLYRIGRELGSLAAALSGLDAIVFTAGSGADAGAIRAGICRRAAWLGVDLDPAANEAGGPRLTRPGSRITAWVLPIDERLLIARHTQAVVGRIRRSRARQPSGRAKL
jgi:acetate kinase